MNKKLAIKTGLIPINKDLLRNTRSAQNLTRNQMYNHQNILRQMDSLGSKRSHGSNKFAKTQRVTALQKISSKQNVNYPQTPPTEMYSKIYQELSMPPTVRHCTAKNVTPFDEISYKKSLKTIHNLEQRLKNSQSVVNTLQAQVKDLLEKKGQLYKNLCSKDIKIQQQAKQISELQILLRATQKQAKKQVSKSQNSVGSCDHNSIEDEIPLKMQINSTPILAEKNKKIKIKSKQRKVSGNRSLEKKPIKNNPVFLPRPRIVNIRKEMVGKSNFTANLKLKELLKEDPEENPVEIQSQEDLLQSVESMQFNDGLLNTKRSAENAKKINPRKHSLRSGGTGDNQDYSLDFDSVDFGHMDDPYQQKDTFGLHNDSIFEHHLISFQKKPEMLIQDDSSIKESPVTKMQMRKKRKSQERSMESQQIMEVFQKHPINEQEYFSPNFPEQRRPSENKKEKIMFVHHVRQSNVHILTKLPGISFRLMGEFLGEKLPMIIFCCRITFKIAISHQIEFYEIQRQNIFYQVQQVQGELNEVQNHYQNNAKLQNFLDYKISDKNRYEFNNLTTQDWQQFLTLLSEQKLKKKDVIILRLYLIFMNLKNITLDDTSFLIYVFNFVRNKNLNCMNPETNFVISSENRQNIKELLINLQKEKQLDDENLENSNGSIQSENNVLEVFTNILFEALQFINIIPNQAITELSNEITELKSVIEAFNNIKNNLIDFKNLVA